MTRTFLRCLPVLVLLPLVAGIAQEQAPDSITVPSRAGPRLLQDVHADTASPPAIPSKSPGLAMLLSAVLPGAGQVYNESYWKVPVVTGLGIYFVAEFLDNNRRTEDYRAKYAESLVAAPGRAPGYLTLREFYKNQRDAFAWYFVILYVLNIVDAYVDASLYGFDVSPALTLQGKPQAGVGIRYTW